MCYRLADEKLRDELKKPLGILLKGDEVTKFILSSSGGRPVITVGDMTTDTVVSLGVKPRVEVVDMKERRNPRDEPRSSAERVLHVANAPGTISVYAFEAIRVAISSKWRTRIVVDGEEDLLALPAIALAPDGSLVFYGQPNEGMVCVEVNAASRDKAIRLLTMFKLDVC